MYSLLQVLLEDWASNPTATSEKYKGKRLRIRGYVGTTDTNFKGQTYVNLLTEKGPEDWHSDKKRAMAFFLDQSILPKMKDFPRGSEIVIDGGIAGKGGTLMLEVYGVSRP